jgi:hypothetical protein
MKTEEKINLVKAIVIDSFNSDMSIDEICGKCVGIEGISFTEIHPLVKFILESEGLIVPLSARKAKSSEYIKSQDLNFNEYDELVELAEIVAAEYDVTEKWALGEIKDIMKSQNIEIPRKSELVGWRLEFVKCFKNNPQITKEELKECLEGKVTAPDNYIRDFYEFAKQLANI